MSNLLDIINKKDSELNNNSSNSEQNDNKDLNNSKKNNITSLRPKSNPDSTNLNQEESLPTFNNNLYNEPKPKINKSTKFAKQTDLINDSIDFNTEHNSTNGPSLTLNPILKSNSNINRYHFNSSTQNPINNYNLNLSSDLNYNFGISYQIDNQVNQVNNQLNNQVNQINNQTNNDFMNYIQANNQNIKSLNSLLIENIEKNNTNNQSTNNYEKRKICG